jgi:hypothetical protein
VSWLSEMPAELEEEELIIEETVLATKGNSSRWKGHVMLVWVVHMLCTTCTVL